MEQIPFNKPYKSGKELEYIEDAISHLKLSGNGAFTQKCHAWFAEKYGFQKTLLTSSCTDALEMSALLLNLNPGDEVIMPSYTFVSTANAFILRGAHIRFCDSCNDHPNMDTSKIEELITDKTKAIIPVHYAGHACDMDAIMSIASKHNLFVIEDAAQAIDSFYKGKRLGGIGHASAFSFHETKNIISGEGGMLVVSEDAWKQRAEIIWEKGTNRSAFFRGEIDKYGWVDVGSSFLPSDLVAAYLYAQLENHDDIQNKRKTIWDTYHREFIDLEENGFFQRPIVPEYASNNGHIYYLLCRSQQERADLIQHLKSENIYAVFHYVSLHSSPYYTAKHDGRELPFCDMFSERLVRLPLFAALKSNEVIRVIESVHRFYKGL